MDNTPPHAPSGKRADLAGVLRQVHPHENYDDDEVLFGRIIDDYADYAQLLQSRDAELQAAELRGRNARIEQLMADAPATASANPASDGLPRLHGTAAPWPKASASFFDLAAEA